MTVAPPRRRCISPHQLYTHIYISLSLSLSLSLADAVAQLSGSKRFLLAPPSAWPLVRVFPFLHPSHAQCQRDLDALDGAELAAAGGQSAI